MKTLFIPDVIHVGYQHRSSTYTQKLAYVIYTDEKGVKRKETSWKNWKDKDITTDDFKNTPTEGFVLNKKVGGYKSHWNFRSTYVRVYDPRGFEFEITIENLLFILENTNSIVGKGLEGEFVYSWDGKDLVLLPVNSQNYIESVDYTKKITSTKKIGAKDMEVGRVYLDKSLQQFVFLGRKQGEIYDYNTREYKLSKGKHFWFLELRKDSKITEEDISELLELYDNRTKNIMPFELEYHNRKGSIESFSGVSSKFIQMNEVDSLALAYGELLLKDSIAYNKDTQKIKRKPITIDELNLFMKDTTIKNGGFNSSNYVEFVPFSENFVTQMKENNVDISKLRSHFNNFNISHYDKSLRLATQYYHKDKEHIVYQDGDDIFELLAFSLEYTRTFWNSFNSRATADFSELDFLLEEESITWVEHDKSTNEILEDAKNGNITAVTNFKKDKDYLGIRKVTVQEILDNLEIEELYHKNHLVRKGIVNK